MLQVLSGTLPKCHGFHVFWGFVHEQSGIDAQIARSWSGFIHGRPPQVGDLFEVSVGRSGISGLDEVRPQNAHSPREQLVVSSELAKFHANQVIKIEFRFLTLAPGRLGKVEIKRRLHPRESLPSQIPRLFSHN